MTTSERKMFNRGLAAGTMLGLAIGGMVALLIALRPDVFAALLP